MNPRNPNDHYHVPIPAPSQGGDAHRQPVLGPLVDLLTDLKRIGSGDLPPRRADQSLTIWQDEYNIYIDSDINEIDQLDVDINVWDGKLLIRLGL
jgi:hypothetical protein